MKTKILWLVLCFTLIISMVTACSGPGTTKTSIPESSLTPTSTTSKLSTSTSISPVTTTVVPPASSSTATKVNWWDKDGQPVYGGTMTYRTASIPNLFFDPATQMGFQDQFWQEVLFTDDFTLDRNIFSFQSNFIPMEYHYGWLAESWEQKDPNTYTVHLRQGIHWQDKPPVNGREFTAYDVEYSYDRILGTGNGFTVPNPTRAPLIPSIQRAVAIDKYTIDFKLKAPSAMAIYQIAGQESRFGMAAKEWVALPKAEQDKWESSPNSPLA